MALMPDRLYVIALCGAADELGHDLPTPLESAATPHLDALASAGVTGTLTVIDENIPPESDSGAMALLGYDPLVRYTGRGPLEGLGTGFLGIEPDASTVCFRINVASLSTEQGALDRRTARDLTDAQLQALLTEIRREVSLADLGATFEITGFGRHRGIVAFHGLSAPLSGAVTNTDPEYERAGAFGVPRGGRYTAPLPCLPADDSPAARRTAEIVNAFVARSAEVMAAGEVNRARMSAGRPPANRIIFRDGGDRLPELTPFRESYGRSLTIFGQVPAEKGLARLLDAGWVSCRQEGGEDDDAYYARLAAELVNDPADVVYVHVKGCDEAAHDGDAAGKAAIMERIDELFFGRLRGRLAPGDLCVVTGDHATPWRTRIHSADPVPLVVSGGRVRPDDCHVFSERAAAAGALGRLRACELMPALTGRTTAPVIPWSANQEPPHNTEEPS
jgi:2,3-bisphosphoglycerate-independent phosphoglycerate mutase